MKEIIEVIVFIAWVAFCVFIGVHCIISQFDTPAEKEQKEQLLKKKEEMDNVSI